MALHRYLWSASVAAVLLCTASNTVLANFNYYQAGNRTELVYPGSTVLAYAPTAFDDVDTISLNGSAFVNYDYHGRLLDKRRTTTTAPGGTTAYEYDVGYDSHRRINSIVNLFQPGGGSLAPIASYGYTHDNNGNPLTQTVAEGMDEFVADDRAFTVDRLNRLQETEYFENGQVESTTFDLVGNRQSHTDRTGDVTAYGTVNAANEYPTIGGTAISYDAAGNLSVDQGGRQYSYDELNRLTQIRNASSTVLANYTYDALGRRITFNDPVAAVTTRFYYDGRSVIEERNAADTRVRYHVNGAQYIDERVATFTDASGAFAYYLGSNNFSVTGTGNADGSVVQRLDYSSTGDFAGGGAAAGAFYHDADEDLDIDLQDFANLQNCFDPTPPVLTACAAVHDFDTADASDGAIDLDDYARFSACSNGPFVTPDQACGIPMRAGALPPSGTFGMHGRAFDVLSDGSVSQDFRARTYLPQLGRWLQRDPLAYNDGANLYEPFRSNSLSNLDPSGEGILTWLLVGRYDLSDWQFIRQGGLGQAAIGLGTGSAEASLNVVIGAAKGVREIGYTAADFVVITVDIPATLAGFPISYDPLSGIGQASRATDSPLRLTGQVAGRAGANIITLGAYNVVEGTIVYVQTGDAEALSQNVGGQGLLTLATVGAARAVVPGRAPVLRKALGDTTTETSLITRFPAVSETGEVNLLNVARRGVLLTTEEASAGVRFRGIGQAAEQRFVETLFDPLVRGQRLSGRGVGRLGDFVTRSQTLNEASLAEFFGAEPAFERFFPATAGSQSRRFLDLSITGPTGTTQIQFIRLEGGAITPRELQAALDIQLRSGQPVTFIVTGRR